MSALKTMKRQVSIGKAYQNVFSQGDGRLVLIDLMKKAKLLEISGDDGPYEGGRRSIVAEILASVRMDYAKFLKLIEEQVDENNENE